MNLLKLSIWIISILGFTQTIFSTDTQCPYTLTNPEDRRIEKSKLRLVQYNIEWMFVDIYSNCPGTSCTWINQSEAITHMDYISKIINDLNPDIINFCEIEGFDIHVGAGYNFSLLGVQTARKGLSGLEFASGIPASDSKSCPKAFCKRSVSCSAS